MFVDSSLNAFSAVALLRGKTWRKISEIQTEFAFVFLKVSVTPLKPLSIPNIELREGLLAARRRQK